MRGVAHFVRRSKEPGGKSLNLVVRYSDFTGEA